MQDTSTSTNIPSTTSEQRKVTFALPTTPSSEPKSTKRRKARSDRKSRPPVKRGSAESKLGASIYLSDLLNRESEREQARRREAGLEPLMELTIPGDFVYTPRIYAFEIDAAVEEAFIQWTRKMYRITDEENISKATIIRYAVKGLRRVTGIHRLEVEYAVREGPVEDPLDAAFPVFAIFYAHEYAMMHRRPTQKQVDKLSKILLGRQPRWLIDFQIDGP